MAEGKKIPLAFISENVRNGTNLADMTLTVNVRRKSNAFFSPKRYPIVERLTKGSFFFFLIRQFGSQFKNLASPSFTTAFRNNLSYFTSLNNSL